MMILMRVVGVKIVTMVTKRKAVLVQVQLVRATTTVIEVVKALVLTV